ncbi:hypothetical protein [Promicromonospora sp. NPDC057488]|uniref:hypothetical protein n=1 Tax=Promicromonospora sp. NPDC057488 TaxID=3346147 RepID=UPI00366B8B33
MYRNHRNQDGPTPPAPGRRTARRRTTAPLLVAAPLLAAALTLTACTSAPEASEGPDDAAASASPGAASASPSGKASGKPKDGDPGAAPSPSTAPSTAPTRSGGTAPMPDGGSGGQSGGDGSEVVPPESGDGTGDGLGDTAIPAAGRLAAAPRTGSASGLVAGFPEDVVLVPSGADVASSSVTGADGRFQVTLDAKVAAGCTDVLLDYRSWFTTGGFTEQDTTARPGRTEVELARKGESVLLTATKDGKSCTVTVFATLRER